MLELGNNAGHKNLIKDGDESTFGADVIEASQEVPVIVDFWAPWCGPCKTLGPALESAVKAANGKVKMVKIDVDQSQQIAAQLQIKSIPTVYGFFEGKPVDAFQGAQSESEIKKFIDKLISLSGDNTENGLDEAMSTAEQMFLEGKYQDAVEIFSAILGEVPTHDKAYAGLASALLELGEIEKVKDLIENSPTEVKSSSGIKAVRAKLDLLDKSEGLASIEEISTKVKSNPDDHQARLDLALSLIKDSRISEAIDHLLELFRRDKDWNDEAAKKNLFSIFEVLKPDDPEALKARRKLSSLIFS